MRRLLGSLRVLRLTQAGGISFNSHGRHDFDSAELLDGSLFIVNCSEQRLG